MRKLAVYLVVLGPFDVLGALRCQMDSRRGPLKQLDAAAVAAVGPNATGVQGDSSKLADLDRLYDKIATDHGRIDVLYANAGGGSMLPLGAITEAHFDETFNRNVKGVVFTVQKALPLLDKAVKGASVILAGSTTGIVGTASPQASTGATLRWTLPVYRWGEQFGRSILER